MQSIEQESSQTQKGAVPHVWRNGAFGSRATFAARQGKRPESARLAFGS
jgi:hypothetical protein